MTWHSCCMLHNIYRSVWYGETAIPVIFSELIVCLPEPIQDDQTYWSASSITYAQHLLWMWVIISWSVTVYDFAFMTSVKVRRTFDVHLYPPTVGCAKNKEIKFLNGNRSGEGYFDYTWNSLTIQLNRGQLFPRIPHRCKRCTWIT